MTAPAQRCEKRCITGQPSRAGDGCIKVSAWTGMPAGARRIAGAPWPDEVYRALEAALVGQVAAQNLPRSLPPRDAVFLKNCFRANLGFGVN